MTQSDQSSQMHATCVAVNGVGVLLRGPSNAGKSDLALRLMDEDAVLVADDRTDLVVRDEVLWGAVPEQLAGLLEVRGMGIVRRDYTSPVAIALVVDLVAEKDVPRLPTTRHENIKGVEIPYLSVCAFAASAPAKIRLALSTDAADWIETI